MYKIILQKNKTSLSEIFQNKRILFSFAKRIDDTTFTNIGQPAKCRDFMNDVLYINKHPKIISNTDIYKFKYDYTKDPHLETTDSIYYIDFKIQNSFDNFMDQFHKLQMIEKTLGLKPCEVLKVQNNYDIILISDKIWTSKILLNNLYTFIIKCLSYTLNSNTESLLNDLEYTFNIMDTDISCIERNYFKNLTKNTLTFLLNNIHNISNFDSYCDGKIEPTLNIDKIHNNSGMISYKQNNNEWENLNNNLFMYLQEKEKSWPEDAKLAIQF